MTRAEEYQKFVKESSDWGECIETAVTMIENLEKELAEVKARCKDNTEKHHYWKKEYNHLSRVDNEIIPDLKNQIKQLGKEPCWK